jgi:hypothetical protein
MDNNDPCRAEHCTGPRDAAEKQQTAAAIKRRTAAPVTGGSDMGDFDGFDDV